jgi:G3E family GTPase
MTLSQGMGSVDYLLIETSGVVDPTETVAALDRKFGKLARVRLDSVVCVVDADSAASGMGEAGGAEGSGGGSAAEAAAAWARQLSAADVVLLNKIDLLEGDGERRAAAREFVERWAPGAKIVECTRGEVPLPAGAPHSSTSQLNLTIFVTETT